MPKPKQRAKPTYQLQDDRIAKQHTFTLTPEEAEKLERVRRATGVKKSRIVGAAIMAIRESEAP